MTEERETLTPRQREALEAVLAGHSPRDRRVGDYWRGTTNMGGAVGRMVEDLEERGYLSPPVSRKLRDEFGREEASRIYDALPVELRHMSGLPVKGLRYLEAYLSGRKFDPTDGRLVKVQEALVAREKLEAELAAFLEARRERNRGAFKRDQEARRLYQVARVRDLLQAAGWATIAKKDDEILDFARAVRAAEYEPAYVRFLDDEDLAARESELAGERHREGSVGATMNEERLAAVRAELARRAKEGR